MRAGRGRPGGPHVSGISGNVVTGPYLTSLRSQIGQISGTCSCAKQKYNALQSTLRRRFSMGLEYQVAFTYSRGMSDSIGYYGQGGQAGSQCCGSTAR